MKYHVEKSIIINAPVSAVRRHIEDFTHWDTWSPWTVIEPESAMSVDGPPGQPGHQMRWEGEVTGSGINTLVNNAPHRLSYQLEFIKPCKSKAETGFTFAIEGDTTRVTWTMDSSMPFFLFFMVSTMKNWIGLDYERGLRMLKEVVEHGKISANTTNNGIVDYEGFSYVGIKRTLPIARVPEIIRKDFERIVNDVVMERKKGAQHWLCIYPEWNMRTMKATCIAAISDEDLQHEKLGKDYVKGAISSGKCLEISHDGSYQFLGNAWAMGMMVARAKKMKMRKYPFEQYWNSPMEVKPEELKTSVYLPVK